MGIYRKTIRIMHTFGTNLGCTCYTKYQIYLKQYPKILEIIGYSYIIKTCTQSITYLQIKLTSMQITLTNIVRKTLKIDLYIQV